MNLVEILKIIDGKTTKNVDEGILYLESLWNCWENLWGYSRQ